MLTLFVLCALLRTLRGASIPSPPDALVSVAATNTSALEPPAAPDDGSQQLRTAYSIAQSCIATILACIWKSAHMNINGPTDSSWTRLKRRVSVMLCTVIAPEIVLFWALNQHFGAKYIAKKYNEEFAPSGVVETKMSLWRNVVRWFQPLPKATSRRGPGQPWTMTHGFFIQMGGFMLYEDEYPKEVLDYDRLAQLLRDNAIDAPTVTKRDLQDRSKGDTISKAIVVQQMTWFVLQCIARALQRLPLSELEVLTLAFAVVNAAIYAAWWNKPQGVDMAICIPLKRGKSEADSSTGPLTSEEPHEPENGSNSGHTSQPQSDQHSNDKLPLTPSHDHENHPNVNIEKPQSWFWDRVQKDRQKYNLPHFLFVRLPLCIVTSMFRPVIKIANPQKIPRKTNLRMPIFYSVAGEEYKDGFSKAQALGFVASIIVGPIFGAIHFIAWASEFPSPRDRILWRISTILMTAQPLLWIFASIIGVLVMRAIGKGLLLLFAFLIPFYIATRLAVIIIAFKCIVHPPPGVLLDVSWTSYIPHL